MNTVRNSDKPMSVEQRKMIFALYRECGIDLNRHRHDVQYGVARKTSLTDFTSHDAARLIDHLEHLRPLTLPEKAGIPGVTSGSAPAPTNPPPATAGFRGGKFAAGFTSLHGGNIIPPLPHSPFAKGGKSRGAHDYITKVHKLPSPEPLAVLDRLYAFAGYATLETQRAFAERIEKHPRPRSMWEAEELIFALVAQAAPKMLAAITAPGFSARLTPFEHAFMFTNCVRFDTFGAMIPGTFNNAKHELEEYLAKRNKRGHRTMPRFSLTKFFEILGKYP